MALTTIIAGVGPGLDAALSRKFCREGCRVVMLARNEKYLKTLEKELRENGRDAAGLAADVTMPAQVTRAFKEVRRRWGRVDILVHNASETVWKGVLKLSPPEFERAWRVAVFGAFLCAQEAARDMVRRKSGTILFTGATSSVRGRESAADFSSAKFGLRGLSESLARELWPRGVHVAHIVIDGMIDTPKVRRKHKPGRNDPLLKPEAIAEAYWALAQQDRSAWSLEIDLRPHNEEFFV